MNFARDVVEAADPQRLALVELAARRRAARVELRRGRARRAAPLAARFDERGVRRGDVVLTLVGNRPEWVLTMVACFRQGYVVLPCTEQLRPKDLRHAPRRRPARRSSSPTSATGDVLAESRLERADRLGPRGRRLARAHRAAAAPSSTPTTRA